MAPAGDVCRVRGSCQSSSLVPNEWVSPGGSRSGMLIVIAMLVTWSLPAVRQLDVTIRALEDA